MGRCTGHCCRSFRLSNSVANLRASESLEARLVAALVKPVGIFPAGVTLPTGDVSRGGAYFDCRMLDRNGDCMIYESRPQMCRDYPAGPCQRVGCTASAE
jgi:Fe-S-cluster containining protein